MQRGLELVEGRRGVLGLEATLVARSRAPQPLGVRGSVGMRRGLSSIMDLGKVRSMDGGREGSWRRGRRDLVVAGARVLTAQKVAEVGSLLGAVVNWS